MLWRSRYAARAEWSTVWRRLRARSAAPELALIARGRAVSLSLLGTFGVKHLLGYSLNDLTLMAVTISTGFVVDEVIAKVVAVRIRSPSCRGPE